MADWPTVRLGNVMHLDVDSRDIADKQTYEIVGVLNRGRGLLRRGPITGAETQYKSLNCIGPEQVVYSRLKAFEGAITVAPASVGQVYASQEFPTFTCGSDLMPAYFALATTTRALWADLQSLSTGMGGRRERVKPSEFLGIEMPLPDRDEQERIVDLVGCVDAQVAALAAEARAALATRAPLFDALLAEGDASDGIPLGDVGTFVRGRRFTKADYAESGLGCIHYGQLHTEFGAVTTRPLTFLPDAARESMRLASPGDVVIAATSETPEGLGKATAWLGNDDVAVHDDCYIYRHSLDPRFASYLFVSPQFENQKIDFAAGTKVTRISGANLARVRVTIPSPETQAAIGATLSVIDAQIQSLRHEAQALREFRSNLLAGLLSQAIEIPSTYQRSDEGWQPPPTPVGIV